MAVIGVVAMVKEKLGDGFSGGGGDGYKHDLHCSVTSDRV